MFVDFNILNQLGSPSINSNTFANRPAAGQTGRLFVSIDTFEIYRDTGTGWDLIGGPGSSTITGTGTANYITKFTGTQSIGNSIMTEGTGLITITGTNPRFVIGGTDDASSQIQTYSDVNTRWKFQVSSNTPTDDADISGYRTRGTIAAPTAILAGDFITNYSGRGYNGTTFIGGGGIDIFAEENYTAIAAGTYLSFFTTSIGAIAETEKIRLTANGFLGINTSTPGARLDVHSTGTIAQFNTTSGTGNTYIAFQRTGTGLWRIGDTYNAGNNFFELHNTVLGVDAIEFEAATNKSTFQAQQTYTTGLARGNYFDYNLSVSAGGSFSSPNSITALGASLDLTLAGNATIPSGARSGLDAYNSIVFTGAGTLTHVQGTQVRAYSNLTAGWAFNGSAIGFISHLAGMRILFPDNTGSAINITNNYALLINDQTANTGTVNYTTRWGIYQEGASDINYFAANVQIKNATNNGNALQVTGTGNITGSLGIGITSPSAKLDIGGEASPILRITSTSGPYSQIQSNTGGTLQFMADEGNTGVSTSMRFRIDGGEVMRLNASGNLSVGNTNDTYKLDVNGTGRFNGTSASPLLYLTNTSGGTTTDFTITENVGLIINSYEGASARSIDLRVGGTSALSIASTSAATFSSSVTTGAPTTGTAAAWKFGSRVAAAVVLDATQYIELDVNGTLYKLAIVT